MNIAEMSIRKFRLIIGLIFAVFNISLQQSISTNQSLFEGDISGIHGDTVLRFVSAMNYHELMISGGGTIGHGAAIGQSSAMWPNGKVYYEISEDFTPAELIAIEDAMESFHRHTCIELIKRTKQDDYILIVSGMNCASHIGRKGGMQFLSLASHCFNENGKGFAIHELMHAIGFFHEQSRSDRDDYIEIVWENIDNDTSKPPAWTNFRKYELDALRNLHTDYDYNSIMHYESAAFGVNGQWTIKPKKSNVKIGQRKELSAIDIQEINLLYKCNSTSVSGDVPAMTSSTPAGHLPTKDHIRLGFRYSRHYLALFVLTADECIYRCKQNVRCDAATFVNGSQFLDGNCFFSNSVFNYTTRADPSMQSGIWEKNITALADKLENSICWGTRLMVDYWNIHALNPNECIQLCKQNVTCDAISFYRANNYYWDNCFFFKSADNFYAEYDLNLQFGAWKKDESSFECEQRDGIHWGARFNKDYYGFRAESANNCIDRCKHDFSCDAITYNNFSTGIEWNCFFFNDAFNYLTDLDPARQWGIWERVKPSLKSKHQYEIHLGIRFMRHYWGLHMQNSNECIHRCLSDFNCEAISYDNFVKNEIEWNCFFFNSANNYVSHLDPTNQWGIWERRNQTLHKDEICWGTNFVTHYTRHFTRNYTKCIEICINDNTCEAISFDSSNSNGNENCLFFKPPYTVDLDPGLQWGSWSKNRTSFECRVHNKFQWGTRFMKHYLRIHAKNPNDCIKGCKEDISCDAISYDKSSKYSNDNCYFFDSTYDTVTDPFLQWGVWKKDNSTSL